MGAKSVVISRLVSTNAGVRAQLQDIEKLCNTCQNMSCAREDLLIVLGEVLNNIVEHAYEFRTDGVIDLKLSVDHGVVNVETRDSGQAMKNETMPAGLFPDIETEREALPESGFGWALIHALTGHLKYQRKNGENILTFDVPKKNQEAH